MDAWHLQTARLRIRPLQMEDTDAWHDVRSAAPFDPMLRTPAQTRMLVAAMLARSAIDADGWQQFTITDPLGQFVGDIGVRFSAPRLAQAEINFAVHPDLHGRGIASEALAAMVDQLFASGRRRVAAVTDARNRAAQRVLERCWFRQEGRFVESWRDGDQWFDELAYARLAHD